ncbi:MAG: M15 family metallopeptidase [Clostridiales Family XIII bacterium]|nr:M15 family metallopeptidase [Clostridiales Family XIII bacterium]
MIFFATGAASPTFSFADTDGDGGEQTGAVSAKNLPRAAVRSDIGLLVEAGVLNKDIYKKSFKKYIDAAELNGVLLSLHQFMGGTWFVTSSAVSDNPVVNKKGKSVQAVRRSDAVGSLAVATMNVKPDEWSEMREDFFSFLSKNAVEEPAAVNNGEAAPVVVAKGATGAALGPALLDDAAVDRGISREEMFTLISRMVWEFERDKMKEIAPIPDTPQSLNESGEEFYGKDVYLFWEPAENAEKYIVKIYDDSEKLIETIRVGEPVLNITKNSKPSFKDVFGGKDENHDAYYTVQAVSEHGVKSKKTKRVYFTALKYQSARERYGTDYIKYKDGEKGKKHQTRITLNVWRDIDGEKVPDSVSIRVHKKVAAGVRQLFAEYFNGKERFPIQSIGGFAIREKRSEHNYGTAIDINPNENFMVGPDGVESGEFWDPEESPYSIPPDSELVRAFERHGWYWAGNGWGHTYDFMHFSYMGT